MKNNGVPVIGGHIPRVIWDKLYTHIPNREIAEAAVGVPNRFKLFYWLNAHDNVGYVRLYYGDLRFDYEPMDVFPSPELLMKLRLLL